MFLMGVTALEEIMKGLMEAGMDKNTPAAILQEGTTARQRRVTATVGTLKEKAAEAGIQPPAVIVAGPVCSLAERLSWYEKKPLAGMRILLTRPEEVISSTAEKLRRRGADVLEVPAIQIVPLELPEYALEKELSAEAYDWIVFTSQAGVRIFFENRKKRKKDIRSLYHVKFAVIGEGTAKALELYGIYADVMPWVYDGESLAAELAKQEIAGKKILIPRAETGNENLVPILEAAGADVMDLPVYRTVYRRDSEELIKGELENGRIDCVVFTSSSTVHGFVKAAGDVDYSKIKAACIGQKTADTAESYGMKCRISDAAKIDSLIELVERIKRDDKETQKIKKQ